MTISVVIPVYNAERFIRFALDSVVHQTYSDWECICVDDGSTDGSGAVLDEYAAKDARFRVVHKANGGEGSARNAGLDLATGELVAFLDADDAWHPESLRLFSAARERTGADVIRYGWRYVGSHGEAFEPLPPEKVRIEQVDFTLRRESTIRFCALGAATVVARAACGDIRFSPLTQGADLVYVLDCLLRSRKVAYVDAPLLHYLTHPGQISRRVSRGLLEGSCGYLPEIAARCARLGESEAAREDTR
ncbi:MAG: glycosyltransferase family 2 protein, partial [Kiritimatiellae bacterium]|nr:glycosyltransferase family 2 protein [Kiritimatiellia bacterium]